jgi:hypothetical protein
MASGRHFSLGSLATGRRNFAVNRLAAYLCRPWRMMSMITQRPSRAERR